MYNSEQNSSYLQIKEYAYRILQRSCESRIFPPISTGGYLQMNLITRIYYSDNFGKLEYVYIYNISSKICAKVRMYINKFCLKRERDRLVNSLEYKRWWLQQNGHFYLEKGKT